MDYRSVGSSGRKRVAEKKSSSTGKGNEKK